MRMARRSSKATGETRLRPSDTFALRLREYRLSRQLSQTELAESLEARGQPMSRTAVLRIEQGERALSLDEALAFAHVLEAAPANLLSPPDGEHVWLTETYGLTGAEFRNWLLFGDPGLVSPQGKRARARMKAVFAVERLAQTIVDASRGEDTAGVNAGIKQLVELVVTHHDELTAIEEGGGQ